MKRIRAYLLFTSGRYKLGMFLGVPVAVLAGGLYWRHAKLALEVGFPVAAGLIFIEIITDQGVFNGIQSSKGYKLDFLKTSPTGRKILFYGLLGDLIRRLLTAVICIGTAWAVKVLAAESGWAGCLSMALTIYVAGTLGIFISRFTRSAVLCVCVAYACIAAGMILLLLIGIASTPGLWIMDVMLGLAAVAVSVLVVRTGMIKWQQTYSDVSEMR